MRVGCRWLAVLSLLISACSPSVPTLPSTGGAPWTELRTDHVTLWTDASAQRGRALLRDIELRRQVVLGAMQGIAAAGNVTRRTRLFVIALRDGIEAGAYGDRNAWTADDLPGEPGMFLSAGESVPGYAAAHELAHISSLPVLHVPPYWLSEGIAQYFEEFDAKPGDVDVEIGRPPVAPRRYFSHGFPRTLDDVLGCEPHCRELDVHATSWAMFSFLLNHHPDGLERYIARIAELSRDRDRREAYDADTESPERRAEELRDLRALKNRWAVQAWREVFPDLPAETFDPLLRRWVLDGRLRLPRIPIARAPVAIDQRTLSDADVLAARAWLRLASGSEQRESVRADVDAALALDRTHVLARLIHAAITHQVALDDARATVAAHPGDWRALRLVELALHGTPEAEQVAAQICAMSAGTAPHCDTRHVARAAPE